MPDSGPTASPPSPSPRAFSHATGYLYQSVGLILALGSCCWWSFSGRAQQEVRPKDRTRAVVEVFTDARPAQIWSMLGTCVSFSAGLGLIPLGLGLQFDRAGSARWAKVLTAAAALFYWVYFGAAAWRFPSAATLILTGALALIWSILFLLAGASLEAFRRHPPPSQPEPRWSARDEDDLRRGSSPP